MHSTKYLISFEKQQASAIVEYNELGYLIYYKLEPGTFEEHQFEYFLSKFPKTVVGFNIWLQYTPKNVVITEIKADLRFETFYEKYDQKLGKKSRAKTLWESLPDSEKIKAINFISKYNHSLQVSGITKKYCETYLSQQIWNN